MTPDLRALFESEGQSVLELYLPDGQHVLVMFSDGIASRSEVEGAIVDVVLAANATDDLPRMLNLMIEPVGARARLSRDHDPTVVLIAAT